MDIATLWPFSSQASIHDRFVFPLSNTQEWTPTTAGLASASPWVLITFSFAPHKPGPGALRTTRAVLLMDVFRRRLDALAVTAFDPIAMETLFNESHQKDKST